MNVKNVFLVIILLVITVSCADVSQIQFVDQSEQTYGFWSGTWHGMIMVPSFFGSLIWDDIAIYGVNNNGHWYNFGYIGGFFIMLKILRYIIIGINYTLNNR